MSGWRATAVVGLAVLAAGCANKLDIERSYDIDQMNRKSLILPPQSREQTVTATVTADRPVNVYVIPSPVGDLMDADKQLKARATSSSENMTTGSFQFKVPANQETNVVFTPAGKTDKAKVTVKLKN
jgi:hypothetical protein